MDRISSVWERSVNGVCFTPIFNQLIKVMHGFLVLLGIDLLTTSSDARTSISVSVSVSF